MARKSRLSAAFSLYASYVLGGEDAGRSTAVFIAPADRRELSLSAVILP